MRPGICSTTFAALNTWAAQKRSMYLEVTSIACVLSKIKSERVAAGEGDPGVRQRWPEVYSGDGLVVSRIVRTLREFPCLTLTYHYVLRWPWRVPVSDQAAAIGVTRREYWNHLKVAEAAVETGLQLLANQGASHRPAENCLNSTARASTKA